MQLFIKLGYFTDIVVRFAYRLSAVKFIIII